MILLRHLPGLVTRRVGGQTTITVAAPVAPPPAGVETVTSPDFLNDPAFTSFPSLGVVNRNALFTGGDLFAGGAAHPHPDKFLSALTYDTAYNPITPMIAEVPADPAFLSTGTGPLTL